MHVSLKPEVQKFVDEQVRAGHFDSADAVLEAGVARLMLDPEPVELDEETLNAIERAREQFERGEGVPLDEVAQRLRAKFGGDGK
jgi:Arc/MetJ-type ribon-helix-helix transcriptional regulator